MYHISAVWDTFRWGRKGSAQAHTSLTNAIATLNDELSVAIADNSTNAVPYLLEQLARAHKFLSQNYVAQLKDWQENS